MEAVYWPLIDSINEIAIKGTRNGKLKIGDVVTSPEIEERINFFTEIQLAHFVQRINHKPLPPRQKGGATKYMLEWDAEAGVIKIAAYTSTLATAGAPSNN